MTTTVVEESTPIFDELAARLRFVLGPVEAAAPAAASTPNATKVATMDVSEDETAAAAG